MDTRNFVRRFNRMIVPVIALTAASANADLRFDLRAKAVNGVALSGAQTQHSIPNALVGDVISFDVFAVVRGTDASLTNDRIYSAVGSFRSSGQLGVPNLRGNLLMDVVHTLHDPDTGDQIGPNGFDEIGFSVGTQQDLDADGDLDVGSNVDSSATH